MRDRDTKGRIVEAAFGLFAERGYHAVSVRDIAAAVGVKDASLYKMCIRDRSPPEGAARQPPSA